MRVFYFFGMLSQHGVRVEQNFVIIFFSSAVAAIIHAAMYKIIYESVKTRVDKIIKGEGERHTSYILYNARIV